MGSFMKVYCYCKIHWHRMVLIDIFALIMQCLAFAIKNFKFLPINRLVVDRNNVK